jgi:hypothetical protein
MNRRQALAGAALAPFAFKSLPMKLPSSWSATIFNPDPGQVPSFKPGEGRWVCTGVDHVQGSITLDWHPDKP